MRESSGLEIAVIGMAGRFPGAPDIEAYRSLVFAGRNALTAATDEELDALGVPSDVYRRPDYVRTRGRLADPEGFDSELFGFTPLDASLLDPQQRVFLECCWHALEHAGYGGKSSDQRLVGVYASASLSTYLIRHLLPQPRLVADVGAHQLLIANEKDTLASRVSYAMDLHGPSVVVQSACSSSLLAVHLACQALISHDCDIAVVGGSAVRLPQEEGALYQPGGIDSPDGECRAFDIGAAGTVGGNGVGVVVVKRLSEALRDGDTVHAVVLGSAVGNDGADRAGFTAPGVAGQSAVIQAALDVAGVEPRMIGYVEGHGSATPLGDAIEVSALTQTFAAARARPWCGLGSVKSLIGHLDAAAGIAGFIKAVLAVRDGVIPPSPYFNEANPEVDLPHSPFYVTPEPRTWPESLSIRRAGVSSFGMGGTSVHVVLEQPPDPEPRQIDEQPPEPEVLVLSARGHQALEAGRRQLAAHLAEHPELVLADVAHTLLHGRRRLDCRLSVTCRSTAEAAEMLAREQGHQVDGPLHQEVAFMFPGQGAQHAGMVVEPYRDREVFRETVDACVALIGDRLDLDLVRALTEKGGPSDELLGRTRNTQPALFVVEFATARLWQSLGLAPRALIGHSVGEYAAAVVAGVLELGDALRLVCARGALMDALPPGVMLAAEASAAEVAAAVGADVEIAAYNAPGLVVLSGTEGRMAEAAKALAEHGIAARRLHTSHAFHSSMMEPALEAFAETVSSVRLSPPRIPIVSNLTGTWMTDQQAVDSAYWVEQLRRPVRFADGVRTLLDSGPWLLLEAGPGTTLTSLVGQQATRSDGLVTVASAAPSRDINVGSLARAWARLWAEGADLDAEAFRAGAGRRRVPLPGYAFQHKRHWIEPPSAGGSLPAAAAVAMAEPDQASPGAADRKTMTGTQAVIADIWRQLIGLEEPGLHDDFFELGGHSLLATRILARVTTMLGVEVSVGAFYERPTIAGLAERVERSQEDLISEANLDALAAEFPQELLAELDILDAGDETERS